MRPKAPKWMPHALNAYAFCSWSLCWLPATPSPSSKRKAFPILLKPYHLHDFLEKVGELLVEAGVLADPIRSMGDFSPTNRKRRGLRSAQRGKRSSMFASRDDYQMSEEELLEWERTEEEERKKREKELEDRKHL